jgi:hypothetical protein
VVSAVFQKVDEVAGLGRLDVFTAADCVPIAAAVHELHDRWIVRSSGAFFTLGVNAYMDLASSADSHATYDNPAKIYNEILLDRFGGVLDTIAAALSDATARRVRLADDLALPGLHVWTASGIPRAAGGRCTSICNTCACASDPATRARRGRCRRLPHRQPADGVAPDQQL